MTTPAQLASRDQKGSSPSGTKKPSKGQQKAARKKRSKERKAQESIASVTSLLDTTESLLGEDQSAVEEKPDLTPTPSSILSADYGAFVGTGPDQKATVLPQPQPSMSDTQQIVSPNKAKEIPQIVEDMPRTVKDTAKSRTTKVVPTGGLSREGADDDSDTEERLQVAEGKSPLGAVVGQKEKVDDVPGGPLLLFDIDAELAEFGDGLDGYESLATLLDTVAQANRAVKDYNKATSGKSKEQPEILRKSLYAAITTGALLDSAIYDGIEKGNSFLFDGDQGVDFLRLLKRLAPLAHEHLERLNAQADELQQRGSKLPKRIHGGDAPELNKDVALDMMLADEKAAGGPKATQRIDKMIKTQLSSKPKDPEKKQKKKAVSKTAKREVLSAVNALNSGAFDTLDFRAKTSEAHDIDMFTTDKDEEYKNWDQKAMYVTGPGWSGRAEKTHKKAEASEPTERKGSAKKPAETTKTGLLIDTTYATAVDYERAWASLNLSTLSGAIDPAAIREVKAPNPEKYRREITLDIRDKGNQGVADNVKAVLALSKTALTSADKYPKIPGMAAVFADVQKCVDQSLFESHADHRGRLPTGTYREFETISVKGLNLAEKSKLRILQEIDSGLVYLTVTHYDPFTYIDNDGERHQRGPFFELQA